MKPSGYNYVLHSDQYAYWFNALTGASFRIGAALSEKVEYCIDHDINLLKDNVPEWYNRLVDNGFIINDDVCEIELIRDRYKKAVDNKDYFLIIIPTLNCNYSCWYCIQNHIPSLMSAETMEAVKKHIDYMIDVEKITSLHIDWFGGEPLMYFNKVVKPISEYAKRRCADKGIPFTNGTTSNGYFITEQMAKEMSSLNFSQYQITLDGDKQFHDKVKFVKGCDSTFEHVLRNIDTILTTNPDANIFLRINYTHEHLTLAIVSQVSELIAEANRNRVTVTPKKVWQEKADPDYYKVLIPILDAFENAGFRVSRHNMSVQATSCYVCKKYYNCINYNGFAVKCTACDDLYVTEPKGIISDNGQIVWSDEFDRKCSEPSFENERCLSCKQLPTCMGLCPRNHINGDTFCKNDTSDEIFENSLLNHLIHLHEKVQPIDLPDRIDT